MSESDSPRVESIPSPELRRLFISSGLQSLIDSGALSELLEKDAHPSQTIAQEPFCTRSQIVGYANEEGVVVVRVHRYLRTDGSIGASGRPDPKYLVISGVTYKEAPRLA
jgi:hypothetical protein